MHNNPTLMKLTKAHRKAAEETGREGGKARAAKMTKKERSDAARAAAKARWAGKKK